MPRLLLEQAVDPGERLRAEEPAARGQRRRVHRLDPRHLAEHRLEERASLPHRIATHGPPRSTSAMMARSVTSSQPRPRCEADSPGRTVSTRLRSITPWSAQPLRSPCRGGITLDVVPQLQVDVDQAPGQRPHVLLDREDESDREAGSWYGSWPDDEHADVGQWSPEGAEDVLARGEVLPPGRDLVAQELAHPPDPVVHRGKRHRPSPEPSAPCRRARPALTRSHRIDGLTAAWRGPRRRPASPS